MNEKIDALQKIKCFILDMDGTIYLGNRLFPFTLKFLQTLKEKGKEFYFFTNNSSKNIDAYLEKLKSMGIEVKPDKMLISSHVIVRHIKKNHPGQSVYVMGTEYLRQDFSEAGIPLNDENPDITVIAFDTSLTFDKLCKACKFVKNGSVYYGVNQDLTCPVEDGFVPDCGSTAMLIEAATGRYPRFFGKPTADTLHYIVDKTGFEPDELAMIGDRLETDIALGEKNALTSILVLTGEATLEDIEKKKIVPDLIFESIEEITKLMKEYM